MNLAKVKQLLACLDAQKIKVREKWVICSCLLAPWTHNSGHDNNPSFGIEINVTGPSRYNCYSCGANGDLLDLVLEIAQNNKKNPQVSLDLKTAMLLVSDEQEGEVVDTSVPDYEDLLQKKKKKPLIEFPEYWLASFVKYPNHPYLKKRGISETVAAILDARYDMSDNRICFPIRTMNGMLAGLQGRYAQDPVPENRLRHKQYGWKGEYNKEVWANEDRVDVDKPLVLTEGWFDVAKIFSVYQNVAGSMTSQITADKAKRLRDATEIITFYDHGTGGDTGRKLVDKYWKKANVVHIIPSKEEDDAGSMPPELIKEYLDQVLDFA